MTAQFSAVSLFPLLLLTRLSLSDAAATFFFARRPHSYEFLTTAEGRRQERNSTQVCDSWILPPLQGLIVGGGAYLAKKQEQGNRIQDEKSYGILLGFELLVYVPPLRG